MSGLVDSLKASIEGAVRAVTGGMRSVAGAQRSVWRGAYDMATAAIGPEDVSDAWDSFSEDYKKNVFTGAGQFGELTSTLINSNPVTKGAAETAEKVYHETVGRGLSTVTIAQAEADQDDPGGFFGAPALPVVGRLNTAEEWRTMFDPDTWVKAYDFSDKISPGQAAAGVAFEGMSPDDMLEAREEGRFSSGALMWTSGIADAGARVLDPVNLVGKGISTARLKYIKPISSTKEGIAYAESRRFEGVEKLILKAKSPDEIRLRLLNNNADGAAVSHIFWNTRHDPELLRIGVRAMYGDGDAVADLYDYNAALEMAKNPEIASGVEAAADLSRLYADQGLRTRRVRIGTDLEEAGDWETYVAGLQANKQLFSQLTVLRPELLDEVSASKPLLSTNRALPLPALRATASSRLRYSLHQTSYYGSPLIVHSPMQKLLPTNRRIHGINFDDSNSDQAVRTYLERAGLPEAEKTKIMNQYIASSGNKAMKMSAMIRAQESVIRHMGKTYGFDEKQVNEIVRRAAEGSGRARLMLANPHQFASSDVQKQWVNEGTALTWTDEMGTAHVVPTPVLESQLMDIFPVADPGALHTAMKNAVSRERGSGVRAFASETVAEAGMWMDKIHQLWKPVVLVGLGYPVRALSDEGGRQIALYGLRDTAMSTGRGAMNTPLNAAEAGRNRWDAYVKERNRVRMRAVKESTLDETLAPESRWSNLAHAFTAGEISKADFAKITAKASKKGLADDMFTAARFEDADLGILNKQEFERALVTRALASQNKNWFVSPFNQKDLMRQVNEDGTVFINPFTGEGLKPPKDAVQVGKTMIIRPDPLRGHAESNVDVYDFVYDHADELLRDGGTLRMTLLDGGDYELRAFRPKATLKQRKLNADRIADQYVEKRRSVMNKPIVVQDGAGGQMVFASPGADHNALKAASSDSVHMDWMLEQAGLANDRIAVSAGWSSAIEPSQLEYGPAWERAVRLQIGNDPAGRAFLENNRDYDMVKHWAENEPDGKRWARQMAPFGDLDSRLQKIESMVNSYVPEGLDHKVLDGTVVYDDLVRAVPDEVNRPQVHGELLDFNMGWKSKAGRAYRRGMNKTMEKLAVIPSDKLSRYPFFAKSYRNHLTMLAKNEFADRQNISVARAGELERAARQKALADVRKWLYNSDMTSDGVAAIRHFSPFSAAWQDGMRAWGKIALQKPQSVAAIYQVWQSPERAGLIVDANGRQLVMEEGKETWYDVNAETGERTKAEGPTDEKRYLQFKLPSWMTPKALGDDVQIPLSINKDSFNTFVHLDPGAGPIVAVAASEILKKHPQWSEHELARRILPFGPTDSIVKPMLSNEARNLYEVWNKEDDTVFRNQAMMILQAEIVKYNQGQRTSMPTMQEATDKATDLKLMRTVLTLSMPVSPTYKSPYQAHIDAYRQLSALDPSTADEKFVELYGDDYFILTARVTTGVKGLPPTMEGWRAWKKYGDMIQKYPEIAGAIMGSTGGEFNKSVYEAQKEALLKPGSNEKLRRVMSLSESMEDAEARLAWIKFGKMNDVLEATLAERGLYDLNADGAEDLKETRDAFVKEYGFSGDGRPTLWYEEWSTRDPAKMKTKLAGFRAIVQDEKLMGRDDIQGLADYLVMRDEFKAELRTRDEGGGAKTLKAKSNSDLMDLWSQSVFDLKSRNISFASLYDRYLQQDDLEV